MTVWPRGYGRRVLSEVDSTLSEAARIAPQLAGPEWILAHSQTQARGRRGRAWSMPAGNFAATLVMKPAEDPATAALRSFVMSLALFRALEVVIGDASRLSLKWPNDVLLDGGKVAGILLESAGSARGLAYLSIGVGVNLAAAPGSDEVEEGAFRPVALGVQCAVHIEPEPFLEQLAFQYDMLEQQFTDYGFAPIRAGWLVHAVKLGETITARMMREEVTGVFEDVDHEGNLILRTAKGVRSITTADVFF